MSELGLSCTGSCLFCLIQVKIIEVGEAVEILLIFTCPLESDPEFPAPESKMLISIEGADTTLGPFLESYFQKGSLHIY